MLAEIRKRLRFMLDVGLDYLTLARSAESLSGGEAQRIRLASLPVEVRWDAVVRRGLLTRFRQTWLRREDVDFLDSRELAARLELNLM